jgi:hypothetical protein
VYRNGLDDADRISDLDETFRGEAGCHDVLQDAVRRTALRSTFVGSFQKTRPP